MRRCFLLTGSGSQSISESAAAMSLRMRPYSGQLFISASAISQISYAESYQHIPAGSYSDGIMPPTTEQAVIMLASHFYESRDGSTGGFFADNVQASSQVWTTVNLLLRLDREWKV